MWTSPKSSLNLQKSIFILLFLHSEQNWVRKSYFQYDLRYSDCLITRWLKNYEYTASNRENLPWLIQIKLSKRPYILCDLFLHFWYLHEISNVPEKTWASSDKFFRSYWLRKMCLFKCIRGLLSVNPLAVNVLTTPKNSWKLQKSAFILLFLHGKQNWVIKTYFEFDLRFLDCLIRRCLETTGVLIVIERIYSHQFKSVYVKNRKPFALLFYNFCNLHSICNILKKTMSLIGQVFLKWLTPDDVLI